MNKPDIRELTAYHEAGHAFASCEMGMQCCIRHVTIHRGGCMVYFDRHRRPVRYAKSFEHTPHIANLELVVQVAGPMAESMLLRDGRIETFTQAEHDIEGARRYSKAVAEATGRTRHEVALEAINFTRELLRDGWPTVQAIAEALLSDEFDGTLSGFQVADICRRHERSHALGPLAGVL